jgi:hypothetical protein
MPTSTIPFDPSLVLGMVIDQSKLDVLKDIADAQKPVDSARDRVNALTRQKLSLDMTMRELITIGADADSLEQLRQEIAKVLQAIIGAATDLGSKVMIAEDKIANIKNSSEQQQISSQIQSPIDFSGSQLKTMPLSSDTMNMDVQYFRYEQNSQEDESHANSISAYVGEKIGSFLGPSYGSQAAFSANSAVNRNLNSNTLQGTVVVCINCTHKNARVFSPIVLDVESAIENWVKFSKQPWGAQSPDLMQKLALEPVNPEDEENGMPILVGESYGSSFVGFVHLQKDESTSSFQMSESSAESASETIESGLFIEESFGTSFSAQNADSYKDLLSQSSLQSHCSVITMGIIPTIKSNDVATTVKQLMGSPQDHMNQLAAMQTATTDVVSKAMVASSARKAKSVEAMKTDYMKAAVDAIGNLDESKNKVIDMNSLMTAIDDYVAKAGGDFQGGVPINFYLKYITKRTIAVAWMQKYYPDLLHQKLDNPDSGDE